MAIKKKERKELLLKIQKLLNIGIKTGDREQIIEAYICIESLLNDHGVYLLYDGLPKFPEGF